MHVRLHGRVQGVGFRWFVRECARKYELTGWVRNTRDGAVEIAAAGQAESLALFEREVRAGPRGARVDRVETLAAEMPPDDVRGPFAIIQ